MTEAQATTLARDVQKQLGADGSEWCRNKDVVVDKKQSVIFEKAGNSTDSALAAVFVPTGYDEYTSSAYSSLLGQIVQPWFYNQLRTEEQLGYAVFAFPMSVGVSGAWASFCKAMINSLHSCGSVTRRFSQPQRQNCGR